MYTIKVEWLLRQMLDISRQMTGRTQGAKKTQIQRIKLDQVSQGALHYSNGEPMM
jgi:hypothetical protein